MILNREIFLMLLLALSQTCRAQVPTASFDRSGGETLQVTESNKQVQVCVDLDIPAPEQTAIRVDTNTIGGSGSATPGVDFEESDVDLIFNVGDTRQCTNITILDDEIEEGDLRESFIVRLLPADGPLGDNIDFEFELYTIEIADSDILLIGFTQPIYEIMEGSVQEVCVSIMNSITLDDDVEVRVNIRASTVSGEYVLSTSSLVLSADPAMQSCLDVTITEDTIIEATESFQLFLEQDNLEVSFSENFATIMMLDSDGATLELNQTMYELVEGDLNTFTNASVCVVLTNDQGGLDRDILLNVTTVTDNATSGVDFRPIERTLTIPRGSQIVSNDKRTCIEFTVIGDDQMEFDETFTISFTPFTEDVFGSGGSVVTVMIEDDNDTLACRTLLGPVNGAVNQQGSMIGATATYSCNANFVLEPTGSETRTCQQNDWSGPEPVCITRCMNLGLESGGSVMITDSVIGEGTVAIYNCFENYEIQGNGGNTSRTCQANGTWSGNAPSCQPIMCEMLPNPLNGGVRHEDFIVGSIATYSCISGFTLEGNENRVCRSDRLWDGSEPICNGAVRVTLTLSTIILLLLAVFIL